MSTIANTRRMTRSNGRTRATLAQLKDHAPEDLITYRISVLAQVLSRLVEASVKQNLGLTARQWRFLVVLNRLGTSPSGEVASMANFDHSQVSRVSFELAELGLVSHENDPKDRRKQIVALTPSGIDALKSGVPVSLERQARFLARMSADEYATFVKVLDLVADEANILLKDQRR